MNDVIREWVEQVTLEGAVIRETHLRAIVRPKPRWLPEALWRKCLQRLLYVEEAASLREDT